jgi:hypothetical protein
MMKRSNLIMALLIVATLAQEASAQGTLKGRMVYDGKAPKPAVLKVEKDGKFCGQFMFLRLKLADHFNPPPTRII